MPLEPCYFCDQEPCRLARMNPTLRRQQIHSDTRHDLPWPKDNLRLHPLPFAEGCRPSLHNSAHGSKLIRNDRPPAARARLGCGHSSITEPE